MKITKNQRPNKEPWGTPDGIAHHVQFIPSMTTLCSHSKRTGDTKITHFCSRILSATLSKAFAKFRKTTSTCLPSSKAFDHWWCDRTNWVKSYYNLEIYLAFHHVCQDQYIYKVYQTKVIYSCWWKTCKWLSLFEATVNWRAGLDESSRSHVERKKPWLI